MSRAKIVELLRERHQRFTPLQRLLQRAADQESRTAELKALLPARLAADCLLCEIQGQIVVVTCRTAAAATKLRFLAPELLPSLQALASFQKTREIRVRVGSGS
ncbi:MAG: DciA family protein [Pseudomonadales bacterium]